LPAGAQLLVAAASDQRSALLTRWNGQLYAVLGNQAEDGRWQMRLWWKPFVT
jgi:cytochrome c-type biogenesis protein CcmF